MKPRSVASVFRFFGLSTLIAMGSVVPLSSCTPGLGAGLAKAPTAEKCDPATLNDMISPLVVEWPSNARSDLEAAMHDNVVVVSFTCEKVTVLPDCKVKGSYGYRAVTPRLETMLIEGRDNIQASFGGVAWAVSGKLEREANLDLSHMLVGKMSTTRAAVDRADLEGGDFCKGATHFVKRADIGAFAYATGTSVKAGVSAKAFTQGASVETESKEVRTKKDGDQGACKASKLADSKPPEGCGAGIRVALAPIKGGAAKATKEEGLSQKGLSDGLGCPNGFSYVNGACVHNPSGKATLCNEDDEAGCQKQCTSGSFASCDRYARVLLYRDDENKEMEAVIAKITAAKARFDEACLADQPAACTALGLLSFAPLLISNDPSDKAGFKRGFDYLASGCRAGDFVACSFLRGMGNESDLSKELGINGAKLLKDTLARGCAGGTAVPCGFQSFEFASGKSGAPNAAKALELAEKSCLGSFAEGCLLYAGLLSNKSTCEKSWHSADKRLQGLYHADEICSLADQVPDDATAAKKYLARACALGAKEACK